MKRRYSIEAPDQARLKIARAEIEAILKKHDLAGAVVLHTPGMAEWFYDIRPSYSCTWIDESVPMVRVKSKLEDYAGDKQTQLHDQAASANMVRCLADNLLAGARMFSDVSAVLDRAFRAQHVACGRVADPAEGRPQ